MLPFVCWYCAVVLTKSYFWCVFCLDETEMWIVIISMVSGALMYTLLVANAAAMMTNVDITAKAYKSKVLHRKPLNWTGKKGELFASVCKCPKKNNSKAE